MIEKLLSAPDQIRDGKQPIQQIADQDQQGRGEGSTGCHYKAMEIVIKERFPGTLAFGLFLARAVRPPQDFDDLSAML